MQRILKQLDVPEIMSARESPQFYTRTKVSAVYGLCMMTAALGLCALWGCASNGYRKGDMAAVSMQKAAAEVQAESRALDHTVTALRSLVNEPGGDLKARFNITANVWISSWSVLSGPRILKK